MKFSDRVADHRRPLPPRGCAVEAVHRRVSIDWATMFYMAATVPWKRPSRPHSLHFLPSVSTEAESCAAIATASSGELVRAHLCVIASPPSPTSPLCFFSL
jgi:hypothetical protein